MITVNDVKRLVIFFGVISLFIHVVIFFILFMPREYTRNVRHFLARLVMLQWVSGSRMSQIAYDSFWQKGNGV